MGNTKSKAETDDGLRLLSNELELPADLRSIRKHFVVSIHGVKDQVFDGGSAADAVYFIASGAVDIIDMCTVSPGMQEPIRSRLSVSVQMLLHLKCMKHLAFNHLPSGSWVLESSLGWRGFIASRREFFARLQRRCLRLAPSSSCIGPSLWRTVLGWGDSRASFDSTSSASG